jgi:hypothetical protein
VYASFCLIRGGAVGSVNAIPGIGVEELHLPIRDASDDCEMIMDTGQAQDDRPVGFFLEETLDLFPEFIQIGVGLASERKPLVGDTSIDDIFQDYLDVLQIHPLNENSTQLSFSI